jgi:hypothetical protein
LACRFSPHHLKDLSATAALAITLLLIEIRLTADCGCTSFGKIVVNHAGAARRKLKL